MLSSLTNKAAVNCSYKNSLGSETFACVGILSLMSPQGFSFGFGIWQKLSHALREDHFWKNIFWGHFESDVNFATAAAFVNDALTV